MDKLSTTAMITFLSVLLLAQSGDLCPRTCTDCMSKAGTKGCKKGWPIIDTAAKEVDLSGINYSTCPPDLALNDRVQSVNLSENLLKTVNSSCFSQNVVLKMLDLSYNKLKTLPNLTSGANVQILNLTSNQIRELKPISLYGLSTVRQLILDNNGLESFCGGELLHEADQLEVLSLKNNNIVRFAANGTTRLFSYAVNLRQLYVSNNFLRERNTSWLIGAPNLELLDLRAAYCSFNNTMSNKDRGWSFPGHSTKLQSLDLSMNKLLSIADWAFSGCVNLERLNLTNCSLTEFKIGQLQDMKKLTHLFVDYNNISNLSSSIFFDLTDLKVLSMKHNNLRSSTIPSISLGFTKSLEIINFSNNELKNLDFLDQASVSNLTRLYLDNNHISVVRHIQKLSNIRVLSFSNNKLIRIPNINTLTNLYRLNLASNNITVLDFNSFWETTSPVVINLSRNNISFVTRGDLNNWEDRPDSWRVILPSNSLTCTCDDDWFKNEVKTSEYNSSILRLYENIDYACPGTSGMSQNISYSLETAECVFIHRDALVILGIVFMVLVCCAILAVGMTIGKKIERRRRTTGGVGRMMSQDPDKKLINERDERKTDSSPSFMIAEKDQHLKDARSLSNLKGSMVRLDNENVKPFFREIYV